MQHHSELQRQHAWKRRCRCLLEYFRQESRHPPFVWLSVMKPKYALICATPLIPIVTRAASRNRTWLTSAGTAICKLDTVRAGAGAVPRAALHALIPVHEICLRIRLQLSSETSSTDSKITCTNCMLSRVSRGNLAPARCSPTFVIRPHTDTKHSNTKSPLGTPWRHAISSTTCICWIMFISTLGCMLRCRADTCAATSRTGLEQAVNEAISRGYCQKGSTPTAGVTAAIW